MVQTYGIASDRGVEIETHAADEHEALLGGNATARQAKREGHATIQSCVGNLANTIIGSGELFYPWKSAKAKLCVGMLTFPLVSAPQPIESVI